MATYDPMKLSYQALSDILKKAVELSVQEWEQHHGRQPPDDQIEDIGTQTLQSLEEIMPGFARALEVQKAAAFLEIHLRVWKEAHPGREPDDDTKRAMADSAGLPCASWPRAGFDDFIAAPPAAPRTREDEHGYGFCRAR